MPRLAAFVTAGASLQQAALRASVAEDLGYELVLDNHIADADGLMALAAYGATTSTVQLGTVRSLFRDGAADVDGEFVHVGGFRFNRFEPRADIPIHLAALGPRMLRLAGEVADGVMLWLCEPGYIADTVVPEIAAGAERAGRHPSEIEVVPAITCCVTDDPGPAMAKMRRMLVTYLSLPFYRNMLERAGFEQDLARFDAGMDDGDVDRAMDGVSDELIHRLAGIGTADEVRAKLDEYRDAGATIPGVGPLTADGSASFEEILAEAIGKLPVA